MSGRWLGNVSPQSEPWYPIWGGSGRGRVSQKGWTDAILADEIVWQRHGVAPNSSVSKTQCVMVQHWEEQREEVRREGRSEKERFWKTRLRWVNFILMTEIHGRVFNRKCKWNQMCLDACAGWWTGRVQGGIFPKIHNISKETPPPGNSLEEGRLQHGFLSWSHQDGPDRRVVLSGDLMTLPNSGKRLDIPQLSKENKVTQRRIRVCPRVWGLCHTGRYYASWSS